MERGIKPEPTLGRKRRFHFYIRDQKAILKDTTLALQIQHAPHRTARAIRGDHIVSTQCVIALGRRDSNVGLGIAILQLRDFTFPADIEIRVLTCAFVQIPFEVILLQIDECRSVMPLFRQQIELVYGFIPEKHLAHIPGHTLFNHPVATSQSIQHFERTFCITERTRSTR